LSGLLSGATVDALLGEYGPGASVPAARPRARGQAAPTDARHYVRYDFRHPNRVSKDLERNLKALHDGFARSLSTNLSAYLRMLVEARVVNLTQLTYGEFIEMLPVPTVMSAVAIPPLEGNAVIHVAPSLIFQMIDRLLGGDGKPMQGIRELTQIEQNVAALIMQRMLGPWAEMWEDLVPLQPALQGLEMIPQMVQVVAPSEITVVVSIELRMRDSADLLSICLPFLVAEPLLAKIGTTTTYGTGQRRGAQAPAQMARQVERAQVKVTAFLGKTRTTLADLSKMQPGDLLVLDRGPGDLIEVHIHERPVFLGRAGTRRGSRAVAIQSAATPTKG